MITQEIIAGPNSLTRAELHSSLGIGKDMYTAARKNIASRKEGNSDLPAGRPIKSKMVTSALQRLRKSTKFADRRQLIRRFFVEHSTPTSRKRDVVKIKVFTGLDLQLSIYVSSTDKDLKIKCITDRLINIVTYSCHSKNLMV